jgi:hypothetical protein
MQLVLVDAKQLRGISLRRQLERVGGVGQQFAERLPDRVGLLRARTDGLAQEPDAVADVAGLVVVDLRVALDEAGQQLVVVEVVGDEFEGRQAEGGFEDLVVEGYEADLAGQVARGRDELLVRLDQGDVEELAESV